MAEESTRTIGMAIEAPGTDEASQEGCELRRAGSKEGSKEE